MGIGSRVNVECVKSQNDKFHRLTQQIVRRKAVQVWAEAQKGWANNTAPQPNVYGGEKQQ
jgi:hypothetical protein